VIEEGATLTASFVERALPKIDLTHEMEPDTGAIMQKGVHKVRGFATEGTVDIVVDVWQRAALSLALPTGQPGGSQ
jgi:hypothetical protein